MPFRAYLEFDYSAILCRWTACSSMESALNFWEVKQPSGAFSIALTTDSSAYLEGNFPYASHPSFVFRYALCEYAEVSAMSKLAPLLVYLIARWAQGRGLLAPFHCHYQILPVALAD